MFVCVRDERVSSIKEFELNFSTLDELNIFLGGIVCGSGYSYPGMCKRVEIPFSTRVALGQSKKKQDNSTLVN